MIYNEVKIKPKLIKGTGAFKDVYFIETRPDLVVKVFSTLDKNEVRYIRVENELAEKAPELFAKILKVNYDRGYMIQEKLNIDDWLKDEKSLEDEIIQTSPIFKNIDIVAYLERHIRDNNLEAIKKIKDIVKDKNNKNTFNKITKYIAQLLKISKSINLDLHKFNLGYDKQKNIKAFDI